MSKADFQSFLSETAKSTYAEIHRYFDEDRFTTDRHLAATARSYFGKPGKALRPALLILSAMLCGGSPEKVVRAAAGVEMFHTWTLLHDDIIDHDMIRRGHDTAHVFAAKLGEGELGLSNEAAADFGQALAILGGDLLHGFAVDQILHTDAPAELLAALATEMNMKLNPELLSGEQMDIRMSYMPWETVTTDMVMEMMRLKTGALLAFCAKAGAALGSGISPAENRRAQLLGDFAVCCGLAFQMQDDILGIFGDEKVFGKPIGSDIREGKRTVMMLDTLRSLPPEESKKVLSILGSKNISPEDVEYAAECVKKSGALFRCRAMAESFIRDAMNILETFPPSEARNLLEQWAEMMTRRSI